VPGIIEVDPVQVVFEKDADKGSLLPPVDHPMEDTVYIDLRPSEDVPVKDLPVVNHVDIGDKSSRTVVATNGTVKIGIDLILKDAQVLELKNWAEIIWSPGASYKPSPGKETFPKLVIVSQSQAPPPQKYAIPIPSGAKYPDNRGIVIQGSFSEDECKLWLEKFEVESPWRLDCSEAAGIAGARVLAEGQGVLLTKGLSGGETAGIVIGGIVGAGVVAGVIAVLIFLKGGTKA
jgi:hypothetical protein